MNQQYTSLSLSNAQHSHLVGGYHPTKFKPNCSLNPDAPGTNHLPPVVGGYQHLRPYTTPKVQFSNAICNTSSMPTQAHCYSELHPLNNYDSNVLENDEDNEIRELTSTGTPDTIPIVNGHSPNQNVGGRQEHENDTMNKTHDIWGHQAKLNIEIEYTHRVRRVSVSVIIPIIMNP